VFRVTNVLAGFHLSLVGALSKMLNSLAYVLLIHTMRAATTS
jgi:hypothetical protein